MENLLRKPASRSITRPVAIAPVVLARPIKTGESVYRDGFAVGRYDREYVLPRSAVDGAHQRIGVEPRRYLVTAKYLIGLPPSIGHDMAKFSCRPPYRAVQVIASLAQDTEPMRFGRRNAR